MANASSFFPYLLGCGNGLELTGPGERHSLLMCGGRFSWRPEPKHSVGAACLRRYTPLAATLRDSLRQLHAIAV